MGLSIARTIIDAHHGLISAKNRDHGGASFKIRLPLVTTTTQDQASGVSVEAIRKA
jgi:K+-sensing histidine kinase KdpD